MKTYETYVVYRTSLLVTRETKIEFQLRVDFGGFFDGFTPFLPKTAQNPHIFGYVPGCLTITQLYNACAMTRYFGHYDRYYISRFNVSQINSSDMALIPDSVVK